MAKCCGPKTCVFGGKKHAFTQYGNRPEKAGKHKKYWKCSLTYAAGCPAKCITVTYAAAGTDTDAEWQVNYTLNIFLMHSNACFLADRYISLQRGGRLR